MIPLTLADIGTELEIKRISGKDDVQRHLENMGFCVGSRIMLVSAGRGGDVIVNVKNVRVGISEKLAAKIMV